MIKLNSVLIALLLSVSIFTIIELSIVLRETKKAVVESAQAISETKGMLAEVHDYTSEQIKNLESQQKSINASLQAAAVLNATFRVINMTTLPKANKVLDTLNDSVLSVNAMVKNTDQNINGNLLPPLTETAKSFNVTMESLNTAIKSLTKNTNLTFAQINDIMVSSEWKEVLKNIVSTTGHIDSISENIEETTDRMPAMADLVEKMMRTSSKWQKAVLLSEILSALIRAI